MLSVFFVHGVSLWWDYNKHIFSEKIRNSHKNPIFALCHAPSCSHCHGLPEAIREYSETQPNRTDITFTSVNCDISGNCDRFGLKEIPQYVLVVGENSIYWPRMRSPNNTDWESFIKHYLQYDIEEISSESDLNHAIAKTANGGTTFHIEASSISDPTLGIMKDIVKRYIVFNDTFTYRLNYSIASTEIYAYRSPFCVQKFDGIRTKPEIAAFVNENRFGYMHRYSYSEWIDENRIRKTAIFFEWGYIDPERQAMLYKLSKEHCKDVSLGWSSGNEAKGPLRMARINTTELPILLITNKKKDCSSTIHSTEPSAKVSWFTRMALNGQVCESRYRGLWKKGLIHMRVKANDITTLIFGGGLVSILMMRLWESFTTKTE